MIGSPWQPSGLFALPWPRPIKEPDRLKSSLHFLYYDMRALNHLGERLVWLRESLFPSAEYMRMKYAKTCNLWVPLLYVHRAATGLTKRFKRQHGPRRLR